MDSTMMKVLIARVIGVLAACTVISLWCWLLVGSGPNSGITGGTYVIGGIMVGLALLAAWGAWMLRSWVLVVAFVASFFPVSFYFLGTPGVFALTGVANVLYLIAAIVLITDR